MRRSPVTQVKVFAVHQLLWGRALSEPRWARTLENATAHALRSCAVASDVCHCLTCLGSRVRARVLDILGVNCMFEATNLIRFGLDRDVYTESVVKELPM